MEKNNAKVCSNGQESIATETLEQAKLQFLDAASAFEPLGVIKRNPLTSVSCAFALGVGFFIMRKKFNIKELTPLLLSAGTLALRMGIK